MAEMGLFGITVPEEYGGLDLDPVSFALVFEETRPRLDGHRRHPRQPLPGLPDDRHARHRGAEAGRTCPTSPPAPRRSGIGLTEPDAGTDLQGIRTTARRDGDHYVVNGTKMWITNARYADPLPVLVKTDPTPRPRTRGMSVLLVDATLAGFQVLRDIPKLGYKGTESCEILLDNVRVPRTVARRRRGRRPAAGAVRPGVGPGQHRRPRRSASRSAPTTRRWRTPSSARRSASRSPSSRRSSSSSPTWRSSSRPPA